MNPIKMDTDLRLRREVREAEARINRLRLDIDLPSEDAIMDEPGRYTCLMRGILSGLERLEQAHREFGARGE